MSHFYASINRSARKTAATARGHKSTGIELWVGSYDGVLRVSVWHSEKHGHDMYEIYTDEHGGGRKNILACGALKKELNL